MHLFGAKAKKWMKQFPKQENGRVVLDHSIVLNYATINQKRVGSRGGAYGVVDGVPQNNMNQ